MIRLSRLTLPSIMLAAATPALAHPGHDGLSGFAAGFVHPLTGLDHLLAMVMVGLWAGIAFPRHWWLCPAVFMSFMLTGFTFGTGGGSLPIAEMLIIGSVVGLGLALAAEIRPPLALSAGVVALFAIGHGFAHGSEMAVGTDSMSFAGGFLLATALLHALGLAGAYAVTAMGQRKASRAAGMVATAAAMTIVWPV